MSRIAFFSVIAWMALAGLPVAAEESAGVIEELRALRQLAEKQARQIEALTKQVEKLTAVVEGKAAPKAEPEAEPAPEPPASTEEAVANAPKAEPAGSPKHIVQKGETLTSIAKHYNIPLADLQKANKDLNPAKMQIGQAITIPSAPASKSPEPTPDKK